MKTRLLLRPAIERTRFISRACTLNEIAPGAFHSAMTETVFRLAAKDF
jgi:hypothetical protein